MTENTQLPKRSQIVQQHLAGANVDSRIRELPESTRTARDAAAALGCEVGAIASSLLFMIGDVPLLVMTSGRHRVDLETLSSHIDVAPSAAEATGTGTLTMATAEQVRAFTGQAIGGVAPIGHPAPLQTVVDAALREYDTLWAAAGTPNTVMPLTFEQLVKLTDGTVIQVAAD